MIGEQKVNRNHPACETMVEVVEAETEAGKSKRLFRLLCGSSWPRQEHLSMLPRLDLPRKYYG